MVRDDLAAEAEFTPSSQSISNADIDIGGKDSRHISAAEAGTDSHNNGRRRHRRNRRHWRRQPPVVRRPLQDRFVRSLVLFHLRGARQ
jgi:hypothetical protein